MPAYLLEKQTLMDIIGQGYHRQYVEEHEQAQRSKAPDCADAVEIP